jgi:HAD superfamily hydrolase (TIGR01509 family)
MARGEGRLMDALLLDYNGVIVQDEPLHFASFRDILAAEGIAMSEQDYFAQYLGLNDRVAFQKAFERAGRPAGREAVEPYVQRKSAAYLRLAERALEPVPGIAAFVRDVARQARVAVVSGALGPEIPLGLRRAGIADFVEVLVTSDDVRTTKPDPEGFRLALRRLAERHATRDWRAVVVEDSLPGVGAARALGAGCVAITTSHDAGELHQADLVWSSFEGHDAAEISGLWRGVPAT